MLFVEVLDFVQVQYNSVRIAKFVYIGSNCFNIGNGCCCCIKTVQLLAGIFGCNSCNGCFACAGRTVKNHIRNISAFNKSAEHLTFGNKMFLPYNLIK